MIFEANLRLQDEYRDEIQMFQKGEPKKAYGVQNFLESEEPYLYGCCAETYPIVYNLFL